MLPKSLFGRLLLASLMSLALFFGLIYYAIKQSYIANVAEAIQAQLKLQSYVLLSSALIEDEGITMPEELREPRFEDYQSGLYGYIADAKGRVLWSSYSSHDIHLSPGVLMPQDLSTGVDQFNEDEDYYIFHYTVMWELLDDHPEPLVFTVVEDKSPSHKKISAFSKSIRRWLIGSGLGLIAALLLTLHWGTHPLRRLARELKQIENGESSQLQEEYPPELKGVTRNLNELIETEHKQRERYHTTLSDLAHSLKTPLTVIQGELTRISQNDPSYRLMTDQSLRMEEIIKHQLQRAVLMAPTKLSDAVAVNTCVDKIAAALDKVYRDKNISLRQDIAEGAVFRGDKRDFMEVLGNVMDNAYAACINTVKVTAAHQGNRLILEIHDDGTGIPEQQRETVLERGQRLDSQSRGQGIGLDVVRDIVDSYEGKIVIEQSPLGGALLRISF